MQLQIRYALDPRSFNFIVSLIGFNQQKIIVDRFVMARIVNPSPRLALGSTPVTTDEAIALGFIPFGHHPIIAADFSEVIASVSA